MDVATQSKISVLLADDHKMIRQLWSMILSKESRFHICGEAADGNEAILLAKNIRPQVALMDIHLGQPDGFETTKQIRKYSPGTRVLGISAGIFPAYAKKIIAYGGLGYITKNSPFEELKTALLEVSEGRQYICTEIRDLLQQAEDTSDPASKQGVLTRREIEIIQMIKDGLMTKEIAERLALSVKTVDIHRSHILKKLQLKTPAALINYVIRNGL